MKIKLSIAFRKKLTHQVRYIAKDKPSAAKNFKKDVLQEIKAIEKMPFSYRKSIFFKKEAIRDLIFKGYIITFRIQQDIIEVFGFHKYENI